MRKLLVLGVALVVCGVVRWIARSGDSAPRPSVDARAARGAPDARDTRGRSANIPAARIVRDAKRHTPRASEKYDPTASMVIPEEFRSPSPPCPDQDCTAWAPPQAIPVIEGAIASDDIPNYFPMVAWFQNGTDPTTRPGFKRCKEELVARVGGLDQDYDAMIALHVVGNGREARVVEVLAHPESWPSVFDDQTRDCWFKLFGGLHWPATQVVDMTFEWPLRFTQTTEPTKK